jgi:ElaB/YqjD/DUF883 family membrane-anchored ribosome-binding protein
MESRRKTSRTGDKLATLFRIFELRHFFRFSVFGIRISRGKHPICDSYAEVKDELMRTKSENGPGANLEQLLEDIKLVVRDGQELLKHGVTGVKERALTSAKTTNKVVRENPYQTIGIVFGVGLVLGMLCYGMLSRGEDENEMDELPSA